MEPACGAAVLPLPAASSATFAAISSVTAPSAAGVMRAVHSVPATVLVKAEAAPLPTAMSPTVKPVTASEKVNVAVKGASLAGGTSEIVTVGAVLSRS